MAKDRHNGLEYILHHYSRDDCDSLPTTQELLENGRVVLDAAVRGTGWRNVDFSGTADFSVFRE